MGEWVLEEQKQEWLHGLLRGGHKADLVSLLCPACLHLPESQKEIPIKSMLTEAVLQLP